jgi:excisionase family DNA binding protein
VFAESHDDPLLSRLFTQALLDELDGRIEGAVQRAMEAESKAAGPGGKQRAQVRGWLSVAEAAAYLGCKPRRIYDLTSARQLRVHKDGRRSLYRIEDLDAVVEPIHLPWPQRGPSSSKTA